MPPASLRPILLVEDSPEDYEVLQWAFRRTGLVNPLKRCATGDEALDYLMRRGAYADPALAPEPGIILLDLNLPGTDGREVLQQIKRTDGLKQIPVVILTTSDHPNDVRACYDSGANSYVQKPLDVESFLKAIEHFKHYWFEIVILPRVQRAS